VFELVLFKVGKLICWIDIENVHEISRTAQITRVYRAREYISGVINLRGQIVSIIDLKKRLGLSAGDVSKNQVVVVKAQGENVGLLIDEINDIVGVDPKDMEEVPANIAGVNKSFFLSVFKTKENLIPVIDTKEVLKI